MFIREFWVQTASRINRRLFASQAADSLVVVSGTNACLRRAVFHFKSFCERHGACQSARNICLAQSLDRAGGAINWSPRQTTHLEGDRRGTTPYVSTAQGRQWTRRNACLTAAIVDEASL